MKNSLVSDNVYREEGSLPALGSLDGHVSCGFGLLQPRQDGVHLAPACPPGIYLTVPKHSDLRRLFDCAFPCFCAATLKRYCELRPALILPAVWLWTGHSTQLDSL